ncbi:DNA mismatch repair endonuclease MutL [Candidatus Gracilibacteria bacterium]|nr:DNA mismatch repair endonuclease MutL [Candidatus Gracilibacteria bacterium]MCF7819765.1 DNA mismatch repair endonuclease MutL [Candidatus Gracilibacteria bacterium]
MAIKILPPSVSDQIAAGEVVERPVSVVKELIENALDAGADEIEVTIEKGGKELIQVRDNGTGMNRQDAEKSILRHATSKLETIDDIFSIQSFGFRGEALAAIASVSDFELITKTQKSKIGTKVALQAGKNIYVTDFSANRGTLIKVRDLFFPTPARKSHLKIDATEYRAIAQEIMHFALSNPKASFRLQKDGKTTLDYPAVSSFKKRAQQVLGKMSENLLKVQAKSGSIELSGFVCAPGECARSKSHQYLFVNGRFIQDYRLAFAIRESFVQSAGIEKHLHPVFVLFLKMDPILVDVNVHPRKLEVKFSEPQEIFSLIKSAVTASLKKVSSYFSSVIPAKAGIQSLSKQKNNFSSSFPSFSQKNYSSPPSFQRRNTERDLFSRGTKDEQETIESDNIDSLKLIAQVERKYILAQSESGLWLFDQHALHERQRFEMFWNQYKKSSLQIQKFLHPEIIEYTEEEIELLHEYASVLQKLGFRMEFSSDTTIKISETPSILKDEKLRGIIDQILDFLREDMISENALDQIMRKVIEYKSCRGAVMFGDSLQPEEMQKLLDDFQTTQWHNLCPHGRPNHIFWSFEELDRQFHR